MATKQKSRINNSIPTKHAVNPRRAQRYKPISSKVIQVRQIRSPRKRSIKEIAIDEEKTRVKN